VESDLSISQNEKNQAKILGLSQEKLFVLVCVLAAFLIRLSLVPQDSVINGDGVYYANLGKKLISGDIYGGISAYWAPLYSFLIGISTLFFRNLEFAGRFVSIVAGTLSVIPTYYLIRNFYGRKPAYLGTFLVLIHPLLIKSSGWVMTESLYTLIFTTAVLIGSYALRKGKRRDFFLLGLLLGTAYLTKPEAIGFVGLFFVLTLGAKFFRRNLRLSRLITGYFLLLLGFAIFFLPYVFFLHEKTGSWTISQKLLSNISASDSEKGLLELTDDGQTTMRDRLFGDVYESRIQPSEKFVRSVSNEPPHLKFNFKELVTKSLSHLRKQLREHIPEILPLPFILIALMGFLFGRWRRERTAKEIYLFSFVACTLLGYAVSVIELRYLLPIIPILIGWVSYGAVKLCDFLTKTVSNFWHLKPKLNPIWSRIFILFVLLASLVPVYVEQFRSDELQNVPFEEKQAGLWLNQNINSPSLVMASSAIPAYYAGANHIFIPNEDFSTVLEYAKRKKVNYLVVSERRLKNTPKAFPDGRRNFPDNWKLVYQDQSNPNFEVFVYQLSE
jgi:4-amino-4-deoxy-L-arabinose transferase-like glycosyltransferase